MDETYKDAGVPPTQPPVETVDQTRARLAAQAAAVQPGAQAPTAPQQPQNPAVQYPPPYGQAAAPMAAAPLQPLNPAVQYPPNAQTAYQPAPVGVDSNEKRKWSGMAIAAFVIGLIVLGFTLFSGYVVIALLPILLGVRAIIDVRSAKKRGMVLAILGIVFAAISGILYVISLAG